MSSESIPVVLTSSVEEYKDNFHIGSMAHNKLNLSLQNYLNRTCCKSQALRRLENVKKHTRLLPL